MVHQTALLAGLPVTPSFYAFVFCGTVCSYNFHWYFTEPPDAVGSENKFSWHWAHRGLHLALALLFLFLSACFGLLLLSHWVWLLLSALFAFLYSAPKIPFFPFNKLRQIAYGKTVFLALVWMHVTTQLPLLVQGVLWQPVHYLFALHRFFLIYAICILFDLRDREPDQAQGIRSMITQMQLRQVGLIYYGVLGAWCVTLGLLTFYFSDGTLAALFFPGGVLLFFYAWFKKQQNDYVYYFLLDGLMIISLPLMLLFQF